MSEKLCKLRKIGGGGGSEPFDAIATSSYGMDALKYDGTTYTFTRKYNANGQTYEGNFIKGKYTSGSTISWTALTDCHVRWSRINYGGGSETDRDYASGETIYNNSSDVLLIYATAKG